MLILVDTTANTVPPGKRWHSPRTTGTCWRNGRCGCSTAAPLAPTPPTSKEWTCIRPPNPERSPDSGRPSTPETTTSFFGSLDPGSLTFAERTLRKLPAARAILPEGDFRDWTEIEDWARSIADELTQLDSRHEEDFS